LISDFPMFGNISSEPWKISCRSGNPVIQAIVGGDGWFEIFPIFGNGWKVYDRFSPTIFRALETKMILPPMI